MDKDHIDFDDYSYTGAFNNELKTQIPGFLYESTLYTEKQISFTLAIKDGAENTVSKLLPDVSLFIFDDCERLPIHTATIYNKPNILTMILEKGANVNSRDGYCRTPMYIASYYGYHEIVIILLKFQALTELRLSSRIVDSVTTYEAYFSCENELLPPLHTAIKRHHFDIANTLIDAGASCCGDQFKNNTPLHIAIMNIQYIKDTESIRAIIYKLLDNYNVVNEMNYDGNTPLHFAVENNDSNISEILIKYGANVNVFNNAHFTPFHKAIEKNNNEIVMQLLQAGADVNAVTELFLTGLDFAISNNMISMTQLLLERPDIHESVENINELILNISNDNTVLLDRFSLGQSLYSINNIQELSFALTNINTFNEEYPELKIDFNKIYNSLSNTILNWAIKTNMSIDCIKLLLKSGASALQCDYKSDSSSVAIAYQCKRNELYTILEDAAIEESKKNSPDFCEITTFLSSNERLPLELWHEIYSYLT